MEIEKQFPVIIVGLGNIGLGYDLLNQDGKIFTHTKAFSGHPGFKILCGVDSDHKQRCLFEDITGLPACKSLPESIDSSEPLVIVIATPTRCRLDVLRDCEKLNPHLLVLEKPIAESLNEGREVISYCESHNISLFVNYIRRCEPSINYVKDVIVTNSLGSITCMHGYYSGGVLNNCSHFIDLILYWLGEPDSYSLLRGDNTSGVKDPEVDFVMLYGQVSCIFQSLTQVNFSTISLEIVFEKGMIRVEDFGRSVSIYQAESDPDFETCFRLGHKGEKLSNEMWKYQQNVVDHLYGHLSSGESLVSTGITALSTLAICEGLIQQLENE